MLARRRGPALRRARRRDGGRHRHGAPALHAHPGVHGRRERHARPRGDQARPAARPRRRPARGCARSPSGSASTSTPTPLVEDLPVGVQQRVEIIKALSRDARGARLRRADRGAHAAGDRRADGHHAPAQGGRHVHRLHHPQAARGPRGRRPHHRHPPRQGRRRGRPHGHQRRARLAHGRPRRRADRAQGRRRRSATRARRQGPHGHRRRRARVGRRRQLHGPRAARSSPSPACRATARPSSPRRILGLQHRVSGSINLDGIELGRPARRARSSTPASASSPRTAATTASSASFTIAENLMLDRSDGSPFVRHGTLQLGALREFAEKKVDGVRRPRPRHRLAGAPTLSGGNQQKVVAGARADAATCGCSSPPSRPAASTSARSSSSTSGSSRPATAASRSWSSRPSSTRSSRSPTGSWSCTAAGSSASSPADTPREVLGLMMAGERPEKEWPRERHRSPSPEARAPVTDDEASRRPTADARRPSAAATRRRAGRRSRSVLRQIASGDALAGARRGPRGPRRLGHDRGDRRARARDRAATSSPDPATSFAAVWDADLPAPTARCSTARSTTSDATTLGPASGRSPRRSPSPTPLIAGGLGVGLAFRAGLFNIGGRGQMLIAGGVPAGSASAFDLPLVIHLLLAILGGIVGGALWAGIAGVLKARTGAHEVIVTIMLNYVAFYLLFCGCSRTPGLLQAPGLEQPEVTADEGLPRCCPSCSATQFNLHFGFIARARRGRRRMVAAQPLHASASAPRRRREPERGARRRHQRRQDLHRRRC